MRFFRSIANMFRSLFGRSQPRLSGFEHGAVNRVLELIRGSTHPGLNDPEGWRPINAVPGTRRFGALWAITDPWGSGWVYGWYCPQTREPSVVVDPANPANIPASTAEHEYAHHAESRMGLAPPWHYPAWRRLFAGWSGSGARRTTDRTHCLPGVRCGCEVTIDTIDDLPAHPALGQTIRRPGTVRDAGGPAQRPSAGAADQSRASK